MKKTSKTAISAAMVLIAGAALAAPTAEDRCVASKNKITGAYYACREKAMATAVSKNEPANYEKCSTKFTEKWQAVQDTGACPGAVTVTDANAFIADQATAAAAIMAGGALPQDPVCGDGVVNGAGEQCDGAALDGYTCASFGLHGTLACTAGCDFNLAGCTSCPAPGVQYGGACWFLSALSTNCTNACTSAGLVYDNRTLIISGSDGSDTNCTAVLDAVGAPGGPALDGPSTDCGTGYGLGCAVVTNAGFRARCALPATTAAASDVGVQRACACK